jgi:hypothetical protein
MDKNKGSKPTKEEIQQSIVSSHNKISDVRTVVKLRASISKKQLDDWMEEKR